LPRRRPRRRAADASSRLKSQALLHRKRANSRRRAAAAAAGWRRPRWPMVQWARQGTVLALGAEPWESMGPARGQQRLPTAATAAATIARHVHTRAASSPAPTRPLPRLCRAAFLCGFALPRSCPALRPCGPLASLAAPPLVVPQNTTGHARDDRSSLHLPRRETARLGSARLGSARPGSARLGSTAPSGATRRGATRLGAAALRR